jgi:hypothetical protein
VELELAGLAGQARGAASEGGAKPGEWFDAKGLLAHGVAREEVERLREAFDRSELALLELEDRARREGWRESPRYREALRDMRTALRAELGDEDFDALLYASGRRNRVVVEELLGGSPAERIGLRPGDEILSYNRSRIFGTGALKEKTSQAPLDAPVEIEIVRDEERMRLWGSGGTLGIRISDQSRPPR